MHQSIDLQGALTFTGWTAAHVKSRFTKITKRLQACLTNNKAAYVARQVTSTSRPLSKDRRGTNPHRYMVRVKAASMSQVLRTGTVGTDSETVPEHRSDH